MTSKIFTALIVSTIAASSAMAWPMQEVELRSPSVPSFPKVTRWEVAGQRPTSPQQESEFNVQRATQTMKLAKSDDARATAETVLREALTNDYDLKMKGYEEHLEKLEKELEAMRDRLSRRRAAKAEMVELRIKVLKAEADDLGWPSDVTRSRNFFSTPAATGYTERFNQNRFRQFPATPSAPRVPNTLIRPDNPTKNSDSDRAAARDSQ